MITLFIGANNVCVLCQPPITTLPGLADADIFEENIRNVLERIRTEVGKSFVNLVALFNVRQKGLKIGKQKVRTNCKKLFLGIKRV